MSGAARLGAVALLLALGACASRASQFPIAQQTLATDAGASCESLGDELGRLAVLRREIHRERSRLNAQDTANVALDTLMFPPMLLVEGPLTAAGASARNRRLNATADAADARMLVLLNLRSERDCAPIQAERADAEPTLAAALGANPGESAGARSARAEAVETYLRTGLNGAGEPD